MALLTLLLMGVGLAWWIQAQRFESRARVDELKLDAMTVRYDLVRLSDSLRAALLDPKNPASKTQDIAAMGDLDLVLKDIEKRYEEVGNAEELMNSMRAIRKFGSERLESYRTNLINLQASDYVQRHCFVCAQSYAPVLNERDLALDSPSPTRFARPLRTAKTTTSNGKHFGASWALSSSPSSRWWSAFIKPRR